MLKLVTGRTLFILLGISVSGVFAGATTLQISANSCLNMRTGPTTKYKRITCVDSGQIVTALGPRKGNWIQVSYNGKVGWLSRNFTEPASVAAQLKAIPDSKIPIPQFRTDREEPKVIPPRPAIDTPPVYQYPEAASEKDPVKDPVKVPPRMIPPPPTVDAYLRATDPDFMPQPDVPASPAETAPQALPEAAPVPEARPEPPTPAPVPATPEAAEPSEVNEGGEYEGKHFQVDVKEGGHLNLWTLPGGKSKSGNKWLGMIRANSVIKQTGPAQGDWVPVEVGEHKGFVHQNYLDEITEAQYTEECDGSPDCRAKDNLLVTFSNRLAQLVGATKYTNPLPGHSWGGRNVGNHWHPIYHENRYHSGQDIPAPRGTPVLAARDGVVVFSGESVGRIAVRDSKGRIKKDNRGRTITRRNPKSGYGYLVTIKHSDGTTTRYGHMLYRKNCGATVKTGSTVKAGQQIGCVGSTGGSTGNHLHFEIRDKRDKPMQPSQLVSR